jgi:transcriptional regulator GlxA family with amidase domain
MDLCPAGQEKPGFIYLEIRNGREAWPEMSPIRPFQCGMMGLPLSGINASMTKRTTIAFFIPPGVHMLDLSGPVQAFYEAGQLNEQYDITYCAFKPDISDSSGLHFNRLQHYRQIKLGEADYLFIPGFNSKLLASNEFREEWEDLYPWLRQQAGNGVRVCSVCVGAFVLARAGLLDGRKCTTHWSMLQQLKTSFPKITVLDDSLFVQDGNIFTSAGISSGIDLALFILEQEQGALFAHKIARELVVYSRRNGHHSQESIYLNYRNHLHRGIHQLQDWLINHLETKTTIEKMADLVNMSSRNLTRTFKLQTGISIHQYITLLRLEKARTLRNSPDITVGAIASQCGFENERQLQRIWRKQVV